MGLAVGGVLLGAGYLLGHGRPRLRSSFGVKHVEGMLQPLRSELVQIKTDQGLAAEQVEGLIGSCKVVAEGLDALDAKVQALAVQDENLSAALDQCKVALSSSGQDIAAQGQQVQGISTSMGQFSTYLQQVEARLQRLEKPPVADPWAQQDVGALLGQARQLQARFAEQSRAQGEQAFSAPGGGL
jgi:chromosome segregation ATPase